ncbi:unnamed protein product [Dibothriocephalus latus]|uniref:Uncharacterized protein n=1 Tax=Dibothriocephalus latus TaxID=60516 RepID=A0A3P7LM45_DIBLA|nr:unnamed protein product [Dibothriocephalus latus]
MAKLVSDRVLPLFSELSDVITRLSFIDVLKFHPRNAPRPGLPASGSGDESVEPDDAGPHHQSSSSASSPPTAASTSHQDLFASFADDPVLTSIVDDIHAIASTSSRVARRLTKKKKKKRRTTKTPTRGEKSKSRVVVGAGILKKRLLVGKKIKKKKSVARLKRKNLKLTGTQKRVRKAVTQLASPTSSLQSTPRPPANRHSAHHSEGSLPPLSILGAGKFCGAYPIAFVLFSYCEGCWDCLLIIALGLETYFLWTSLPCTAVISLVYSNTHDWFHSSSVLIDDNLPDSRDRAVKPTGGQSVITLQLQHPKHAGQRGQLCLPGKAALRPTPLVVVVIV